MFHTNAYLIIKKQKKKKKGASGVLGGNLILARILLSEKSNNWGDEHESLRMSARKTLLLHVWKMTSYSLKSCVKYYPNFEDVVWEPSLKLGKKFSSATSNKNGASPLGHF